MSLEDREPLLVHGDDGVLLPGEAWVIHPETGERCIKLTPEDEADLREALKEADATPPEDWIEIVDPEEYVRGIRARINAKQRAAGHGATSDPDR